MALVLLVLAFAGLWALPWPRSRLPARDTGEIGDVRNWGYQLQRAQAGRIANDIDMLVIDYSADGTEPRAYSPAQVDASRAAAAAHDVAGVASRAEHSRAERAVPHVGRQGSRDLANFARPIVARLHPG